MFSVFQDFKKEWDFLLELDGYISNFFKLFQWEFFFSWFRFVVLAFIVPTFLSFRFKPIKFVNCQCLLCPELRCMTTCHLFWLTLACLIICRWRRPSTKALFQTTYFVLGCDEGDETLSVKQDCPDHQETFFHSSCTLWHAILILSELQLLIFKKQPFLG